MITGPLDRTMQPFGLNDWIVEPSLNQLRRGDTVLHLEPKSMDVLCALAARANETISRAELLNTVWKGRVVVDEALSRVVGQLRQALGDDPKAPVYIQTIRQRGYRLLVTPQPLAIRQPQSHPRPQPAIGPRIVASVPPVRGMPRNSWARTTAAALMALVASAGLLWRGG
ncbi:MAG: winged helix-turn-helix domain-containing protein [Steroidobacteraceae bacterium]